MCSMSATCSTVNACKCGCHPLHCSLVVRGAVPEQARFPIPLSIRTCGFPAYGLPMIFLAWLRCLRIADRASEPVEPVPVEPVFCPRLGLTGVQVPTPFPDHQGAEPPHDVVIGLAELPGGIPGAEVVPPAAQQRVQVRDDLADVCSRAVAAGTGVNFVPEPLHRLLRGPAVQVVAHDALLRPQAPRHAGAEMASEEVQALPAVPEIDYLRLVRVQSQPQAAE